MKTKDELQKQKARDLMKFASSLGIKGAWDMRKAELIEAILANQKQPEEKEEVASKNQVEEPDWESKQKYCQEAPLGTLVAFIAPNGKCKSAKIVNRSSKRQMLKLETEYQQEFVVPYKDIVWVRTGTRWPRGVYNMLKGLV